MAAFQVTSGMSEACLTDESTLGRLRAIAEDGLNACANAGILSRPLVLSGHHWEHFQRDFGRRLRERCTRRYFLPRISPAATPPGRVSPVSGFRVNMRNDSPSLSLSLPAENNVHEIINGDRRDALNVILPLVRCMDSPLNGG